MTLAQTKPPVSPLTSGYDCDLVIVGGGIAGATLACSLKDSGLKVIIIESQPLAVAAARKQAYAVSLLSSRIYKQLGVWEQILPQISSFKQIRLSDA
ncbi:MAG: FAD-dependent oxidoreductase, partial [Spirulinaceae cyanobacterium]